MSVPEQVPYKEYRATGSSNTFEITFYLPDPKDLVVMVNKEIPLVGAYSIQGNTVVFSTPPNEGDLVEITRDTQMDRETNFKSYDNSFRPETINFDLDKIWLVLQESNLIDAKILARLKQEIEWRRTHDFNYDELAQVREKQLFDALKGYTDTLLASTNPGVFQGVIAGVVFARDGKSIQTHLEEILDNLALSRSYVDEQLSLKAPQATTYNKIEVDTKIGAETTRAKAAELVLQNQVNAVGVGNKAYLTYAEMDADKANNPINSKLEVTNDGENNGTYQWNGTALTKSAYDPLTQAKAYSDSLAQIEPQINLYTGVNTSGFYVRPADGFISGAIGNEISVFAVEAGKTYAMYATDVRPAYLILSYSTTSTVSGGKQNTLATINSTADPNIKTFTVPTGMKYAFVNTVWPNFNFDIRNSLVVQEGVSLIKVVKKIRGVDVYDESAHIEIELLSKEAFKKSEVIPDDDVGTVLSTTSHDNLNVAPSTGAIRSTAGCEIARFDIVAGKRYKIKAPDLRAAYVTVSVSATSDVFGGKAQTLVTLAEIDSITKVFTAPSGMISACINTVWPNFSLDISATLIIEEYPELVIDNLASIPIRDNLAHQKIEELENGGGGSSGYVSVLKNKKWVFIGDSITASNNAWATKRYHDYVVEAVGGMTTQNLGISSTGYGDRTLTANTITLENPDYITIFMGTNDFGVINDNRNAANKPYPMGEFLSLTNLTVSGAINTTLTNIFNAFPNAKVAIITPLPRGTLAVNRPNYGENPTPNVDDVSLEDIANELIRYAKHYSLPVLDLYHHSNFKAFSTAFQNTYMTDGVHPNDAGHAIIGQKVLKFMESL
ncbi:SGNH/GDSL hydrolase family protein [Acinetobacter sp. 18QD2AZ41W]|uniref:SGNH/GDSL hydrolase family protein n=1 Tax=Acinetobacter sp. 18QD2AZ41W TaxID=2692137 RepID=UPI00135B5D88|nr:SGNH/GDSL hydrolase family protein [Acinetobacter sp. 18QD2AZ41W]